MLVKLPEWLKSAEGFTMAVGGPTRQDTYLLNIQVAHPVTGAMINYGIWDKLTGGIIDSDETKYYPGGMVPPVSLGGRKTTDNVVVSRLYRLGRDHDSIQQLFDGVGKSKAIITKQPLDLNANVYGRPIVYNGVLKRVTPPDVDSETSAAALIELEFTIEGFPSS